MASGGKLVVWLQDCMGSQACSPLCVAIAGDCEMLSAKKLMCVPIRACTYDDLYLIAQRHIFNTTTRL